MPSAQRALTSRSAATIATVGRSILTPDVIEDADGLTILVPVRDNSFSPALNCGEFAICDTRQMRLEDGALYYKRDTLAQCYSAGEYARTPRQSLSIVKVREVSPAMANSLAATNGDKHPPPYWDIGLGWSPVLGSIQAFRDAGCKVRDGHVLMSDGPMSEKYLLPMIIGRVVGVLGSDGRALKWRDA